MISRSLRNYLCDTVLGLKNMTFAVLVVKPMTIIGILSLHKETRIFLISKLMQHSTFAKSREPSIYTGQKSDSSKVELQ